MPSGAWRHVVLVFAVLACAAALFTAAPIPQPLDYHRFADTRTFAGVPNALNVLSNVPFAIVGIVGLIVSVRARIVGEAIERRSYVVLFTGVALTMFGSARYHLAPDNDRLVWDRLPMAVGFMGLLTALLTERVHLGIGRRLLGPLLLLGAGSVLHWYATELRNAGDLRPYLLVQFGSLFVIVVLLIVYPARYS